MTSSQRSILFHLSRGHHITYSQDGENAWLYLRAEGLRFVADADVIALRKAGWIEREAHDPDEDYGRFGPGDVISATGLAALQAEGASHD
jgi:hypothetical protein